MANSTILINISDTPQDVIDTIITNLKGTLSTFTSEGNATIDFGDPAKYESYTSELSQGMKLDVIVDSTKVSIHKA